MACALALAAALPFVVSRSLAASRCPLSMDEAAEPAGWRAWPLLPGLAGYEVRDLDPYLDLGITSWRPHALGDARLFGNGVCAERGLSLKSWFRSPIGAAYMRNERELTLRRAPQAEIVVVGGQMNAESSDSGPLTFVAAFAPDRDGPLRFFLRVLAPPLGAFALFAHVARGAQGRAALAAYCSCRGRSYSRWKLHDVGGTGTLICRRCGLWVAFRPRADSQRDSGAAGRHME